jgi:hypothetical protein
MVPDSRSEKAFLAYPHARPIAARSALAPIALPRAARPPQRDVLADEGVHRELPLEVLALLQGVVGGRRQREPPLGHQHILVLHLVEAVRDHRPEVGRLEGQRHQPLVLRHVEEGLGGHTGARLDRLEGVLRLGRQSRLFGRFEAAFRGPGQTEEVFGEVVAS